MREGGKIEVKNNGEVRLMAVCVAKRLMATNIACSGGGRLVGRTKGRLIKGELRGGRNSGRGEELEGVRGWLGGMMKNGDSGGVEE